MKKNKKNSKGMTLVEVIVALTIFTIMAACIMAVIGAAIQSSNRSRRRDLELAQQANAAGKLSEQELDQIGSANAYTVRFTPVGGGAPKEVADISIYQSSAAQFGSQIEFNIKTFLKGNWQNLNAVNNEEDEYVFVINNELSENVTAYVDIADTSDGYIYEGAPSTGYRHSARSYVRTISKKEGSVSGYADFGFKDSAYANGNISIRLVTDSGVTYSVADADVNLLTASGKTRRYVISIDGYGVSTMYS